jgi:hypothetical protein
MTDDSQNRLTTRARLIALVAVIAVLGVAGAVFALLAPALPVTVSGPERVTALVLLGAFWLGITLASALIVLVMFRG